MVKKEKKDSKMTSINLDHTLYTNFKRQAFEDNISLTLFVTNAINTYLSESNNNKALKQVQNELQQAFSKM